MTLPAFVMIADVKADADRILDQIRDDARSSEEMVALLYDELRRMAAGKMQNERNDHTLQATALVNEAYLRLLGPKGKPRNWDNRGHFISAAAEAMRRILIENARRKNSLRRGGGAAGVPFDESKFAWAPASEEILCVDEALERLENEKPDFAEIVKLRYFAGLTVPETASAVGLSASAVERKWRSARAWLYREIRTPSPPGPREN